MNEIEYTITAPAGADAFKAPRNSPVLGVTFTNGEGKTLNRKTALEFKRMGFAVTPDPEG